MQSSPGPGDVVTGAGALGRCGRPVAVRLPRACGRSVERDSSRCCTRRPDPRRSRGTSSGEQVAQHDLLSLGEMFHQRGPRGPASIPQPPGEVHRGIARRQESRGGREPAATVHGAPASKKLRRLPSASASVSACSSESAARRRSASSSAARASSRARMCRAVTDRQPSRCGPWPRRRAVRRTGPCGSSCPGAILSPVPPDCVLFQPQRGDRSR